MLQALGTVMAASGKSCAGSLQALHLEAFSGLQTRLGLQTHQKVCRAGVIKTSRPSATQHQPWGAA